MTELVLSFGRDDSCFPIYQLTSTLLSPGSSPEDHGPALPSVALSPPSSASTYVVTLTLELSLAFNERFSLVMDLFDDQSNASVDLMDIREFFAGVYTLPYIFSYSRVWSVQSLMKCWDSVSCRDSFLPISLEWPASCLTVGGTQ